MAADSPQHAALPRFRRPMSVALNAIVFLAALAATSSLLTALAPFPDLGNLARKYQHIEQHGDDYDVIYVGSSRVFHEFIPAKFDAELAARGHTMRSFNFGQDGMWPPESLYMLRKILATRPPKLRWVFIDLMNIRPVLEGAESSLRGIYWHDLRHTWMACRHIIESSETGTKTASEKLAACWHHTTLCMQRGASLGEGHGKLELQLGLQRAKRKGDVTDGGYEAGENGPLTGEQRVNFLSALSILKAGPAPKPIPAALRDALEKVIAEVRAAGAEPVFVVASNLYGMERFSDWPPAGVRVLAFDDPAEFPQLYDADRRFDPHHLDPVGAAEFTRLLAGRFAGLLEEKR